MPVETRWYVEKRLIYQRFSNGVTLEDFRQGIEEIHTFIDDGIPLVHTISDVSNVTAWPSFGELLQSTQRSAFPGTGWTLVIVSNPKVRFITSVLGQLARTNFRIVASVDEALKFLAVQDMTLNLKPS